jgi:hypothetical protein
MGDTPRSRAAAQSLYDEMARKPSGALPAPARLSRLTFYKPRKLSGRVNGWTGVDRATGDIFIYSFTM